MNRTDKLKKALANKYEGPFDQFYSGEQENARLSPLHKVLCDAVEALENIEFCPRSMSEYPIQDMQITAKQILTAIDAALEGVG